MEPSETLSAEQVQRLADELSDLSKQQSKALQASAYLSMNAEEARAVRIAELYTLIVKFKPSRTGT